MIGAVRARLKLMLTPTVTSALVGALLAAILLAIRPARRLQLSDSSVVGDKCE